jgi:hypothetical protein
MDPSMASVAASGESTLSLAKSPSCLVRSM